MWRRNLPSLHALAAFEATAHFASFTKAARALNVQQPAVSRQVAALEAELNTALFRRTRPALELTPAGRRLLATVKSGFDGIEQSADKLRQSGQGAGLRIDASIGLASCWLMPRLADFRRQHPEIDISLMTRDLDPDCDMDRSDLVLRFGDGRWPGVTSRLIFKEEVFPICSPSYLQGRAPTLTPAGLLREKLLHYDDGFYPWTNWPLLLGQAGITVTAPLPGPTFNSFIVLIQAAMNGEGIALGWAGVMDDALKAGSLVKPCPLSLRSERGYFTAVKEGVPRSPQVQKFQDWVSDQGRAGTAPQ